jgi:hypothetical protein
MEVFWRKGFEGASLADLTEAMGINPPSLLRGFRGQGAPFPRSDRALPGKARRLLSVREEPTAEGATRRLLTYMADDLTCCTHPRGCMMVMAAATSTGASPELQAALPGAAPNRARRSGSAWSEA